MIDPAIVTYLSARIEAYKRGALEKNSEGKTEHAHELRIAAHLTAVILGDLEAGLHLAEPTA